MSHSKITVFVASRKEFYTSRLQELEPEINLHFIKPLKFISEAECKYFFYIYIYLLERKPYLFDIQSGERPPLRM